MSKHIIGASVEGRLAQRITRRIADMLENDHVKVTWSVIDGGIRVSVYVKSAPVLPVTTAVVGFTLGQEFPDVPLGTKQQEDDLVLYVDL